MSTEYVMHYTITGGQAHHRAALKSILPKYWEHRDNDDDDEAEDDLVTITRFIVGTAANCLIMEIVPEGGCVILNGTELQWTTSKRSRRGRQG